MRRYLFLVPFYLLAALLPLLTTAGTNLEYEYTLMLGYLALVLIPAAGLCMPRRWLPIAASGAYAPPFAFDIFWTLIFGPLALAAPAVALFYTGKCSCSAPGFGFWMVLGALPASVLAHAIFQATLRARVDGAGRGKITAAILCCYSALVILAGAELWLAPQKRLVSLLLGVLHGPIYDSWIAFDDGLLLARSAHLALALGLMLAAWYYRGRRLLAFALTCTMALWFGLAVSAAHYPSVLSGKPTLDGLLFGTLKGHGFTLHYLPPELAPVTPGLNPKKPSTAPSAPLQLAAPIKIERLFRDAQFHIDELSKTLATGDHALPHVEIYVYPSEDLKKLWFGGGGTDITDVRTPSIHITEGMWPHPTLRHELVHALASGFGYHGLGFHPNMAFTEGLAVALAPAGGSLSLDDASAALMSSGKLPPIENLFSPAFWRYPGDRAYTVAGSLIRFLVTTRGIAGVKALYSGSSWDVAFGNGQEQLLKAWREHVLTGYDKERNSIFSDALFRSPGILEDRCPHSKADLTRARDDGTYVRTRQPIGFDPDVDYLPWLQKLDASDQDVRLKLWRREVRHLAQDRFPAPGQLEMWRQKFAAARAFPPKSLEDVDMGVTESDLTRLLGDTPGSIKILQALQEEAKKHAFGDSLLREINARLAIEVSATPGSTGALPMDPEVLLEWRRYLAGWRKIPDINLSVSGPEGSQPWLFTYLKLRNDREVHVNPPVLVRLLTEVVPDPQLSLSFHHEWYKLLATRLMLAGDYKNAATAYQRAAEQATSTSNRELYEEHSRRASYYDAKGPLKSKIEAAATPRQAPQEKG